MSSPSINEAPTPTSSFQLSKNDKKAILLLALMFITSISSGLAAGFATHNYNIGLGAGFGTMAFLSLCLKGYYYFKNRVKYSLDTLKAEYPAYVVGSKEFQSKRDTDKINVDEKYKNTRGPMEDSEKAPKKAGSRIGNGPFPQTVEST